MYLSPDFRSKLGRDLLYKREGIRQYLTNWHSDSRERTPTSLRNLILLPAVTLDL
jgi:hypothetical protein